MEIGKAKYGGEFTPTKYWKLKDGESTYRILPPLGDLAKDGIWSVFYKIHYGYRNSQGKMRVFQSSLVKSRKAPYMVEVPDAALERIEKLKGELEKAKAGGNHAAVGKFKELLQMYNLDNNHYVNAMDSQGNIGILKLRHRAKQALDAVISKLSKANIDPLSAEEGRYFTFTRTGNGLDTTFQVAVAQQEFEAKDFGMVKRDIVHKITPEILVRLKKEARQLNKLFKKLTADEVANVVKHSDLSTGVSPVLDDIFDTRGGEGTGGESTHEDEDTGSGITASGSTASASASGGSLTDSMPSGSTPYIEGASDTHSAAAPLPSAQTTAQKVSQMNDQEFQKYLGSLGI